MYTFELLDCFIIHNVVVELLSYLKLVKSPLDRDNYYTVPTTWNNRDTVDVARVHYLEFTFCKLNSEITHLNCLFLLHFSFVLRLNNRMLLQVMIQRYLNYQ